MLIVLACPIVRATRTTTCPGCGWYSGAPFTILVGGGNTDRRVVICSSRVPVNVLRTAEDVYAWSRSGWSGVVHTCTTDTPTLEQAGWFDLRPWRLRHRTAIRSMWALVAAAAFAGAVWCAWQLPFVIDLTVTLLVGAVGFTLAEDMGYGYPELPNWRTDRHRRYR